MRCDKLRVRVRWTGRRGRLVLTANGPTAMMALTILGMTALIIIFG